MGREIRKVPPNWRHPKDENGKYMPMYDQTFDDRLDEWLDGYRAWQDKTHPNYSNEYPYWSWEGAPPDPEYYRPDFEEKPTWYQIYETVSEGTPVSPPFATKAELIEYLVQYGDFWDQARGDGGWDRATAEHFIDKEWAPSGIIIVSANKSEFKSPRDGA